MSRIYAQYSTQEKEGLFQQQIASSAAMRNELKNRDYEIQYLNACLYQAFELLERAEQGKPFKRKAWLLRKGHLQWRQSPN